MARWYYQKKELRCTPSTKAGLDPSVEARYRREGARFIMELGTSMNLSLSTTLATAVVFFHRFYMCHSFIDFPRYPAACACLFLAGKVEETPKKCKDMIESARKLVVEHKFLQQFGADERTRFEEVMTLERILLQTIKFDLQLEHPYKYLLKYANCLKGEKSRLEKMVQMAWNFVNDSLCTTLCLQWEPEIIAIALMYLACKLSKFEVHDWSGRQGDHLRWWDNFVQDMTIEVLEDICHQVLDFYSQAQQPNPPAPSEKPEHRSMQNSPTPGPSTSSRAPPQHPHQQPQQHQTGHPLPNSQPPPKPATSMMVPQQAPYAYNMHHQHQQGIPNPVPPPNCASYPPATNVPYLPSSAPLPPPPNVTHPPYPPGPPPPNNPPYTLPSGPPPPNYAPPNTTPAPPPPPNSVPYAQGTSGPPSNYYPRHHQHHPPHQGMSSHQPITSYPGRIPPPLPPQPLHHQPPYLPPPPHQPPLPAMMHGHQSQPPLPRMGGPPPPN